MNDLPEDVQRAISYSASPEGVLRIGGPFSIWEDLDHWRGAPRISGLYMIGLKLGIQYERAVSRIVYIGGTRNLRNRIESHNAHSHNYFVEYLKVRYRGGLLVTWIALPGLSLDWLRALEDAALQEAERQLGLYPLCNTGRIDSPHVGSCANLVRIFPCDELPFPRSVDLLREQLGSNNLGRLAERKPADFWERKSKTSTTTVEIKIGTSLEMTPNDAPVHEFDPEPPTWITEQNVATWKLDKVRQLLTACQALQSVPRKAKSKVRSFAASSRRVPRPNTWGEVALVQGRIVAGTWFPAERLWVKVLCGKELLGQAILERNYYRGEDKSELPQSTKRASIWESKQWLKEAEAIRGEVPADVDPRTYEADELPEIDPDDSISADHVRLLTASREFDLAEARRKAELEQRFAIDRDKGRRCTDLLRSRIESTFLAAFCEKSKARQVRD